jgi:arylformamidase
VHPRERLHLFRPAGRPRGLAVVLHGGYWMAFAAADFSHLAGGALGRGWAVAMPSTPLAPEARVGAIVRSAARAVDAAADAVPGPVALAGHSAGGHLALRLACADVPLGARSRLARVVAVSPLANLLPLLRTGMNATLGLDAAEALAESPMLRPRPAVPVTAWVGAAERPAFRLQALWLARAWGARLVEEPGRHHFDVIEGLERPGASARQRHGSGQGMAREDHGGAAGGPARAERRGGEERGQGKAHGCNPFVEAVGWKRSKRMGPKRMGPKRMGGPGRGWPGRAGRSSGAFTTSRARLGISSPADCTICASCYSSANATPGRGCHA